MEQWVGEQWHRLVDGAARRGHPQAGVEFEAVRRAAGMLFRAAGGAAPVRLASSVNGLSGGTPGWLQRLAGTDPGDAVAQLQSDVLVLPASVSVFSDRAGNRSLLLWLAAQAAALEPTGHWASDNLAATRRVLCRLPGLRGTYQQLLAGQLAQRPDPARLKLPAALAERRLQAMLRASLCTPPGSQPDDQADDQPDDGMTLSRSQLAPVWLWVTVAHPASPVMRAGAQSAAAAGSQANRGAADRRRRHAQAVSDERHGAPLLMMFRAESLLSWGEFVKVNRASDDQDDGQATAAADDMAALAIAPDGQSAASRVRFDLDLPSAAADDRSLGPGIRLPEWDWRRSQLLPAHCAVSCRIADAAPPFVPPPSLRATAQRIRRRLESLRAAPGRARGRTEGEELDVDAWVRLQAQGPDASYSESPPVFIRRIRAERSLATLLLADLSQSTDAYATQHARVIDVIREALYVFGEALSVIGDPFEMLGFSSVRRQNVRIQHLKGFEQRWDGAARNRVGAIRPGFYTRMGAAVRYATLQLQRRPERQRLLLILTDGKPNDLDVYEGRYGLEDTRHAVQAARAAGLTPFCVTIDQAAHDYLPALFGQHGYALVHRPADLVGRLSSVYAQLTRG